MANYGNGRCFRSIIAGRDTSTERHCDAQRRKVIPGNEMAHGNVILTSSVDSHLPCPVGECLANVLIRLLKTIDERIANLRVVSGCQEKELLWPTNRERLQEHRVHQAENGGVRA